MVTDITRVLEEYISDITNSIRKSTSEQMATMPGPASSSNSQEDVDGNYYGYYFFLLFENKSRYNILSIPN